MALADVTGGRRGNQFGGTQLVEAFETRRLLAIVPVGAPGVLAASGVTAVESASAAPDTTNNFRYATYLSGATAASVTPVSGPDSSTPGTSLALPLPANATVSNTDVASNTPSNTFVVVYQVTTTTPAGPGNPGGSDSDIYAAVFANGAIVGSSFRVNTAPAGNQTNCRVAMDGSGNFVVVWESSTAGARLEGRRFNVDGTPAGAEFTVNATGVEPDVAANAGGAFVVVYNDTAASFAQIYNANGSANGTPIQFNSESFTEPAVGLANNGRFVVAWGTGAGATRTVVARRFTATGAAIGAQFNASTATLNNQTAPEVAVDTAGGFAIGWAQASSGFNYDSAAFRVFRANGVPAAPETVISGVQFAADNRFGLAYRVPGLIHVAYADTLGEALMQTYQDDTGGNSGLELPVPGGALLIDLTALTPGVTLDVGESGNTLTVTTNGTSVTHPRSSYTSIYVRGTTGNDLLDLNSDVTLPAIIYGRAGADTIYGTSANDQIDGGDGGQVPSGPADPITGIIPTVFQGNQITGRGGNDYVYGGDANDTLFGDTGDDRILGGGGKNVIYGEDGNDVLIGGNRADALFGGAGDDSLLGNDGGDYLDGGAGNDTLLGGDGVDRLFGNNGNDSLEGDGGADILHGGRGDDRLFGNDGRDTLFGEAGTDYLRGGGVGFGGGGIGAGLPPLDIVYFDGLDTVVGQVTKLQVI